MHNVNKSSFTLIKASNTTITAVGLKENRIQFKSYFVLKKKL